MKMNELDALLRDFDETADHLHQLAAQLRNMFTAREEPEKKISFTELRALCASKSRDGFTGSIRQLIVGYGASKLSEVEPNRYRELYEKVEALK